MEILDETVDNYKQIHLPTWRTRAVVDKRDISKPTSVIKRKQTPGNSGGQEGLA